MNQNGRSTRQEDFEMMTMKKLRASGDIAKKPEENLDAASGKLMVAREAAMNVKS